jgi:hypothetical protein
MISTISLSVTKMSVIESLVLLSKGGTGIKKGDASLPSNYRPISLISCVGKIMERVVYKNVDNYLVRNKLIYEYQSGFLPKHSSCRDFTNS